MRRELAALALLAGMACGASAQILSDEPPPWVESETVLPTLLRTAGLIPIAIQGTSLRFGIDPQSVSVGKDGVIRYVVVATSASGALNAMQEGVRCMTRQVKTYARYSASSGWRAAEGADWRPLTTGVAATRHSAVIAGSGLCGYDADPGQVRSAAQVLKDLRSTAPAGSPGP